MPKTTFSVLKTVRSKTAMTLYAIVLAIPVFSINAFATDTVTVAILATPSADGAQARKQFSEKINPLGIKAGITNINGIRAAGSLVGNSDYGSVFMLDFASRGDAEAFFESTEYKALIPLRDAGYDKYDVLIGQ